MRESQLSNGKIPDAWRFKVLGVPVHAVQIPDVVVQMESWIRERSPGHFIVAANTHVIMECRESPAFKDAVNAADLVTPDGMPLVWIGRRRGFPLKKRAYGPELMGAFLNRSASLGYRHFFYGGTPKTVESLVAKLRDRWPTLQIAGFYAPPFRPLTKEEDRRVVEMVNEAAPDVLWVGLGCPKQEQWMYSHRLRLQVPAMVGVGQAFDLLAAVKRQAPGWMRDHGAEWLFRLFSEPKRLWRRYLIYGSKFICYSILEQTGLRKFD